MVSRSSALTGLFVVLTLAFTARPSLSGRAGTYKIGDKVADFSFKNDQGKTMKLSDFRGKTVVLVMFATWCPPCNEEAPHMEKEVWQKFKAKNVQVLALDVQEGQADPAPKLRDFRKKHQVTYPILSDEDATIMQKFGFIALPTMLIIDKNGKYVANPQTVGQIVAKIQKLSK